VALPVIGTREIPIIADAYVDREFGSGAVKITPARLQRFRDRAAAQAAMGLGDGRSAVMTAEAGPYAGSTATSRATRIVRRLRARRRRPRPN